MDQCGQVTKEGVLKIRQNVAQNVSVIMELTSLVYLDNGPRVQMRSSAI